MPGHVCATLWAFITGSHPANGFIESQQRSGIMNVQFGGIYRLERHKQSGPFVEYRHPSYFDEALAIQTVRELRKSNPETAYFVASGAGTFIFRNDSQGDHFTRFSEVLKPLQGDGLRKTSGISTGIYHPLVLNPFMTKALAAIQALVDLINAGQHGTVKVAYSLEKRANRFNSAQWANAAAEPGSDRVRSAIHLDRIDAPPN